jgi:nicotinate-nucleotide adenylyltransferase
LRGKVGVFGGTFNPIHNGHILIARTAVSQFELSRVVFVPNGIPPDRQKEARPGKEDRFQMVAAAVAGEDGLDVSRIEVDREGPSYTIDTIRALKEDYREGVCFIIGADRLAQIDRWKEPEAILASVPFIVAPRAGVSLSAFDRGVFAEASVWPLEMSEVHLSSTVLRARVRRGEPIRDSVPASVEAYIVEHGLYRGAEEA